VSKRTIADLPGPRGLPLLGNLHQVRASRLHLTQEEWCQRYGPIFRYDLGRERFVCIAELDAINDVLRNRPHGFKRGGEVQRRFEEFGFQGLFSEEGDIWKGQRRLVVTALNSNKLQRYFGVLRTANERLHRRFADAARREEVLDIDAELMRYTVDITTVLAFGQDLNTIEHGNGELQRHIQHAFDMLFRRMLVPIPYWRWVKLPADRALDRSLVALHRAAEGFVERARRQLDANPELAEEPENLLQGMLAAQHREGKFSDREIIGNAITLLLAGEDTTAHSMAWTLWFLATRPESQERWREEALDALDGELVPTAYESVEQLPFGEAALREAMRLKPVAPWTGFDAIEETTIMGVHIPKGTKLVVLLRQASLHDSGIERATEFDPDRWLADETAPDQSAFLAFGAGPRFCPGRNLAFLEAKAALATIAASFELELDETAGPAIEHQGFTMGPRNLRIRLRQIAAAPERPLAGSAA